MLTAPAITSTAATSGAVGVAFQYDADGRASASGTPPITWSASQQPAGFTIDASTGEITWTPAAAGTDGACITATNAAGADTQCFTVDVLAPAPPVFTSQPLVLARVGEAYVYDVDGAASASGTGPIVFSAPPAPAGVANDAA
jgi:hypothetical protein